MDQKIAAIIPVYLYSPHLEPMLEKITGFIPRERVLIVDDGSPNDISEKAGKNGFLSLRHHKNLGKGAALRTGFNYWVSRGIEWVITLDGDGQHDPADIPKFIDALKNLKADLFIGSRMTNMKNMPFDRQLSNRLTSRVLSLITHQHIEDSQCGFRLIKLEALKGINWKENGFAFESEMILSFAKRKKKMQFVPIKTIYFHDEVSSMQRFKDTLRFLRMILTTSFRN
ncbi:MAG: glycosyltransferase family 2 protein [Candidatus Electryonea clarkiae]|nr:glycosyltransferase family 2 protein [Candidatus Electryonea clarkiae]MDP8286138.1 glycosyltransferase family 2 protein [Candidatus Electryonea clarkiae]